MTDPTAVPGRKVLTLDTIARNHAPRSTTGIPPALVMAGRADLLAGCAAAVWNHDPAGAESLVVKHQNAIRNILNARNAAITASAQQALRTVLSRNLPDRASINIHIGAGVQIADRGKWNVGYRAIAHSAGNLTAERGRQLLKWQKQKCLLPNQNDDDPFDHTDLPEIIEGEEDLRGGRFGEVGPYQLPEDDDREPGRPSRDQFDAVAAPDDEYCVNAVNDVRMITHPKSPFATNRTGSLAISSQCLAERGCPIDSNYSEPMIKSDSEIIPISVGYRQLGERTTQSDRLGRQILDRFDPSRIPPRVAFCPPQARTAIIKEIDDLLRPHDGAPPAMVQIDLYGPRYLQLPRAFSTLIVKRKPIDIYKARLRTRGDVAPLKDVAFVSSPTAHRVCIRLLITLATIFKWQLKTLDISQAFLQSSNLNDRDRLVIIPPSMITMPWKSELPPEHVDLEMMHRSRMGFLLVRPLYGGRGAPMRWFVTFSTILRKEGYRKLKTDVCALTRAHIEGELAVFSPCMSTTYCSRAHRFFYAILGGSSELSEPAKPKRFCLESQ